MDPKGTKKSGTKFQTNREAEMKVKEIIMFSQPKSARKKELKLLFFSSFTCFFLWQVKSKNCWNSGFSGGSILNT